jgi:PAS domain S-box-containing protein
MAIKTETQQRLLLENEELRRRVSELEDTLEAIRSGSVDAIVVSDARGEKIYSLQSADYNYRVMVETINEGAIILDPEGVVIFCNRAFASMVGREVPAVVGARFSDFLLETSPAQFSAFLKDCSDRTCRRKFALRRNPGGGLSVDISSSIIDAGSGRHFSLIVTDLSERKRAEWKLQKAYEEVEGKVRERTVDLQRANESLRESEVRLSLAQRAGNIGAFELDLRTNKVLWTPELEALFGLPPGSFGGMIGDWEKCVHPEDLLRVNRELKEGLDQGRGLVSEYRIIKPDNSIRWIEARGTIIYDDLGNAIKLIGINKDITDAKQAAIELKNLLDQVDIQRYFLETLIENAPVGIAVINREHRFVLVNAAYKTIPGAPGTDLVGRTLEETFPLVEKAGGFDDIEAIFATGKTMRFKEFETHIEGKEISYWNVDELPLKGGSGRVERILIIAVDVTEVKRAENALRRRTEELEAANKELESFSYSVAHDLRNPLRVIGGFADDLLTNSPGPLGDQLKGDLSRIKRSAERMNSIIEDMLALSGISRQEINIVNLDLSEMARLSVGELAAMNPGRAVEVKIQEGLRVRADARLVSVALGNLLGNAWKYTSRTEHPKIEFGSFVREGKRVFFVKDNGAGFDMNRAEKLFAPFQRLHSEREFKGIGLGLAIVARAVDRHGGKVWAHGEIGRGATFYFTLEG